MRGHLLQCKKFRHNPYPPSRNSNGTVACICRLYLQQDSHLFLKLFSNFNLINVSKLNSGLAVLMYEFYCFLMSELGTEITLKGQRPCQVKNPSR